jgi:hypothetical protein
MFALKNFSDLAFDLPCNGRTRPCTNPTPGYRAQILIPGPTNLIFPDQTPIRLVLTLLIRP